MINDIRAVNGKATFVEKKRYIKNWTLDVINVKYQPQHLLLYAKLMTVPANIEVWRYQRYTLINWATNQIEKWRRGAGRKRVTLRDDPSSPTPEATDLASSPRVHANVYRILRDTKLARQVKALHNFECQICGGTIELPDGTRYAESHHLQPLGKPHNGPDVMGNILCVCPNHHAELDYGVRDISLTKLSHSSGHSVDQKYIDYHNQYWEKRAQAI